MGTFCQDKYANSLEIQRRLMHAVNYNQWLYNQVAKYIGNSVLEVGCALGNFTRKLADRSFICAMDIEEEYVRRIKEDFKDRLNLEAVHCDISSSGILGLRHKFDTVICFNVLEHINDDARALSNMQQLLSAGGHLCLIVPAFPVLFGSMDETDHHYRRYSRKELLEKISQAGLSVVDSRYINILGFLSWWLNGKVFRKKFIPFRQLLFYDKVIPLVSLFERIIGPPFGQSMVLIAKKS